MKLRKQQQKKGDCLTDGHKQAGDPWSFLALCESIINGDFSSYRPIPCREEQQQQNLIQNASIPAKGLGEEANQQRWADGASGSGAGAQRRGASEPAGTACPRSRPQHLLTRAPLRYTVGAADRPGSASPGFVYRKIFKMETWLHF